MTLSDFKMPFNIYSFVVLIIIPTDPLLCPDSQLEYSQFHSLFLSVGLHHLSFRRGKGRENGACLVKRTLVGVLLGSEL